MTKQGAGQVVDDLARQGLVERIPDPADGRAALIVFTDAGWDYLRAASAIKQEIETEYAQLLGEDAFRTLCEDLARIIDREKQRANISAPSATAECGISRSIALDPLTLGRLGPSFSAPRTPLPLDELLAQFLQSRAACAP